MAEEKKKPRIDLKARLGKTMAAAHAPSVSPGSVPPPAVGDDGVPAPPAAVVAKPKGIAPPPGLSQGIPLPPFATQPAPKRKAEPKQSAQAQTIKVEVGEEVHAARKGARRMMGVFGLAGAVVGLVIGFTAGGQNAESARQTVAINQAGELEDKVKTATDKMREFAAALEEADTAIKNKKFPEELVTALQTMEIPFDAAALENKQIGAMVGATKKLVAFTSDVEDLNRKKNTLQNVLGAAKGPVVKAWEDEKAPKFTIGVNFGGGTGKVYAELIQIKDEWDPKKEKWPEEFTIIRREWQDGKQKPVEKKAELWVKGEVVGGEKPRTIPVDPASVAGFTSEELVNKLRKALLDTRLVLEGDPSDPTEEKPGLIKDGDALAAALHKVAITAK